MPSSSSAAARPTLAWQVQPDWWSLGVTMFVLFSDRMPFHGSTDEKTDEHTCNDNMADKYKHGEPADLQKVITALCTKDVCTRLGCSGGVEEVKRHAYFSGFDWAALEAGTLKAPIEPNVNDINAPSAKDIKGFTDPPGVTWGAADQQRTAGWNYFSPLLWQNEAIERIKKKKELKGGGGGGAGGGGCCTIA